MEARGEGMKNGPKSLKSVKEACMQCLFAVQLERWKRFRWRGVYGAVYIGKEEKKENRGENEEKCE